MKVQRLSRYDMVAQFVYDGTFEGFLTGVFDFYERKPLVVKFVKEEEANHSFFDEMHRVYTEEKKADRVWKGIQKKIGHSVAQSIYRAFLSERPDVERILLNVIRKGFNGQDIAKNFGDVDVLRLHQLVKMVGREKHRMDAFVRFRLTRDQVYFATIEPDFNTLPLNAIHFKNRYADQKWLIYDLCRGYGVFYDKQDISYVQLEISKDINSSLAAPFYFTEDEMQFQELWQNYFKSTNIPSRKNMRLHLQHVPRRYWKYLSEKQPDDLSLGG